MTLPSPKAGILSITPYVPGKTSRAKGVTPLKLSSNENSYGASPKALAALSAAANTAARYPDGGSLALREAIASVHHIEANNIVCGAGSDELIGLIVHAYAGAGDEVLYPEHGFLMYKIYALGCGATPVEAKETNLTTNVDALLAAVTPRTKIVFLANPNNPTGSYISSAELTRLRQGLREDILLVIDGAYAEYVEESDYSDGLQLALNTPNTIMLRTFSKIYGLGGVRIGWMVACPAIIDVMNRLRSPFNVSSVAQVAGAAAIADTGYTADMVRKNAEGRAFFHQECLRLGLTPYPSVTNFILVDFGTVERADKVVNGLLEQAMYIRDTVAYKLPSCLRITVGTMEENTKLVAAMGRLL
jgi:histidinol-phosphate aminotransferase